MLRFHTALLFALVLGGAACSSAGSTEDTTTGSDPLTDLPANVDEGALDRTADPCNDFFQFACGGYLAHTTVSDGNEFHSLAFDGAEAANEEAVADIVAKASAHPTSAEDRKLADYVASCIPFKSRTPAPGQVTAALQGPLSALAAAKANGAGAMLASAITSSYGVAPPFVTIGAAPDRNHDPNIVALEVSPTFPSPMPEDVAAHVAKFYPDMTAADQAARVARISGIEKAFADAIGGSEGLDQHPIGRDGLALAMPHVDWTAILGALGVPNARHVNLYALDALTKIDALIGATSLDDLGAFLEYELLVRWSNRFTSAGPDNATAACNFEAAANLPGIIEHRFVDTVLGQQNTKIALAMAQKVLQTFRKRLETTEFLDPATRVEALTKAREMQITPLTMPRDTYSDVTLDRSDFVKNAFAFARRRVAKSLARVDGHPGPASLDQAQGYTEANAFYDAATNRFTILPGIAHGSFFGGASAPAAHNFGALGWVIGHEMTHGFDNFGRLFDGRGAGRDWWTPAAKAAFEQRSECFVDQYGAFAVDGVTDPTTGQIARVNGQQTLGENIADNGGIRTAYQTAAPYFASGKTVAGFTPEQQFFLAAGQTWCEKAGADYALGSLRFDPHSPGKARVNVTLSNFEKFAGAFHCGPNAKMVAQPACQIW